MSEQKAERKHTPQAFPCLERGGNGLEMTDPGMTLRDYFAGQELAKTPGAYLLDEPIAYERLARHCYRMADAMLTARTQEAA